MKEAHDLLSQQQAQVRGEDDEEPLHFEKGDLVLRENRWRRKGESFNLHTPFVGQFSVPEAFGNHTYKIDNQGQISVQNESRIKEFRPSTKKAGRAPVTQEAWRMPNMKGVVKRVPRSTSPQLPLQPVPLMVVPEPEIKLPPTQPAKLGTDASIPLGNKNSAATSAPAAAPQKSTRLTSAPARF